MEYVLVVAAFLLLFYGIWFFRNLLKSGRAKKIHRDYQSLLDQKLEPLGFEKKEELVGGRERIALYRRDSREISLNYEISYDHNSLFLTNGRNSTSIKISNSTDSKDNFIKTLERWLAENQ